MADCLGELGSHAEACRCYEEAIARGKTAEGLRGLSASIRRVGQAEIAQRGPGGDA
jgi:hypothetical protein